jgi:ABC-type lipoprotein export system ATPase subunit
VFIKIEEVVKTFNTVDVLSKVSLTLEENKQYAITGASGSGKSTLLYLIGGLDKPTSGEISVDGQPLSSMNDDSLASYRNNSVGFVFQFHFLLPSMNSMNNILLPAKIGNKNIKEVKARVLELAKTLGVEHCLKKYPFQLSGGEQQRINIIRALSLRPKLLLCDEPTGNLDSTNTEVVCDLLKNLSLEYKSTLVVVTHDEKVSDKFENRIYMQDGKTL